MEKIHQVVIDVFKKESYLDAAQLKRLSGYKFKADDKSLMTRWFLGRYWDKITDAYPLWLAPNTITLMGLVANTVGTLILAWYSPDCASWAPRWAYLVCALGLFLYQSLDNTDGRQARRTNSASPLGELFDHGCDCLSQVFLGLQPCLALSVGDTRWGVLMFWLGTVYVSYAAHWEKYTTGVLRFTEVNLVESQVFTMLFLLISGMLGPDFWYFKLFGFTLRRWVMICTALSAVYLSYSVLYNIYTHGAGKNGRTVANTSPYAATLPILLFLLPPVITYWTSKPGIYDQYIFLFCLTFGMVFIKYAIDIQLASMFRHPLRVLDTILLIPLIIGANRCFGNVIPEVYMLFICLLYGAANIAFYGCSVCQQICDYMKIKCFVISHDGTKQSPTMNGSVRQNGIRKGKEVEHQ